MAVTIAVAQLKIKRESLPIHLFTKKIVNCSVWPELREKLQALLADAWKMSQVTNTARSDNCEETTNNIHNNLQSALPSKENSNTAKQAST